MAATSRTLFAVSEIELVYHNKLAPADRIKINGVETAYNILLSNWDINKMELVEQFYVMLLDRSHACLGISHVSTGGMSSCNVDPKVVFGTALKSRATGIILAHNHPSGILNPSVADRQVTKQFIEGGRLLDIQIVDHLIVSPHDYYSFAENQSMQPG
jgi:DNA repair protein RadC